MSIVFSDGLVHFGTCERVLVGHWRAPFSLARLAALRAAFGDLHARFGADVGMLGVFETHAVDLAALSDDAIRNDAAKLQSDLVGKVKGGQSIVLEGAGFGASALRSAALALQTLSRAPERPVFHPDVATGIAWLDERLRLGPARRLEIERLHNTMRAAASDMAARQT